MNSVMVNIRMAIAKEAARPMSRIQAGTGRTIITITAISANASRIVGRNTSRRVREKEVMAHPCGMIGRPIAPCASGTSEPITVSPPVRSSG